jgi:hypothetical protein
VSLGIGGFRYGRKLGLGRSSLSSGSNAHGLERPHPEPAPFDDAGRILTASASTLAAVAPDDVVANLQKSLRRPNLFKAYAWVAGVSALLLTGAAPILGLLAAVGLVGLGVYVHRWDRGWRCSQLIYDLDDPEIGVRVAMANLAGQALGSVSMMWHVHHATATHDRKRNAGASTLIKRTRTRTVPGTLSGIELNIDPWAVPVGPQQLLFLPDRLLVWDGRVLAGVPYEYLECRANSVRFIEDGAVPSDAQVVDTTWQFVNKQGGPDRRFANNRELPVVNYGELLLSSPSGLCVFLQTSTAAAASDAARSLSELSARAKVFVAPTITSPTLPPPSVSVSPMSVPAQSSAPHSETRPASPATTVTSALMILMRGLASADRKIDPKEIEIALMVHRQLTGSTDDPATFGQWFRNLSVTPVNTAQALRELASASLDTKRWILELLEGMTHADGNQTPKEIERLSEIRAALTGQAGE